MSSPNGWDPICRQQYLPEAARMVEAKYSHEDVCMNNERPATTTVDDDDDRDDEHAGENEAPVRETDELTETPEEMEIDDEDDLGDDTDA